MHSHIYGKQMLQVFAWLVESELKCARFDKDYLASTCRLRRICELVFWGSRCDFIKSLKTINMKTENTFPER